MFLLPQCSLDQYVISEITVLLCVEPAFALLQSFPDLTYGPGLQE